MSDMKENALKKLETNSILRLLVLMLDGEEHYLTKYISKSNNPYSIASQSSLNSAFGFIDELGLAKTEIVHVGITKSTRINYSLTEKGREVAELVKKIKEKLEE